ncbi:MAG: hypothetical protein K8T25_09415 [Planctomycetia bacterium]|nr:hypothetical protein [Planctomycetia bacterium]
MTNDQIPMTNNRSSKSGVNGTVGRNEHWHSQWHTKGARQGINRKIGATQQNQQRTTNNRVPGFRLRPCATGFASASTANPLNTAPKRQIQRQQNSFASFAIFCSKKEAVEQKSAKKVRKEVVLASVFVLRH